jgi:hypothetical protein
MQFALQIAVISCRRHGDIETFGFGDIKAFGFGDIAPSERLWNQLPLAIDRL